MIDAFLDAIGGGSGGKRMAELQWRTSGVLRLERAPPLRTATGKVLHLHHDLAGETGGSIAAE